MCVHVGVQMSKGCAAGVSSQQDWADSLFRAAVPLDLDLRIILLVRSTTDQANSQTHLMSCLQSPLYTHRPSSTPTPSGPSRWSALNLIQQQQYTHDVRAVQKKQYNT